MKINTKKIQKEMKRVGMTLEVLGNLLDPKTDRKGAWYLVHHAKEIRSVNRIARALDVDAKDLLL